jgi:hypothetical protein
VTATGSGKAGTLVTFAYGGRRRHVAGRSQLLAQTLLQVQYRAAGARRR